jgi:multidrug efflux pump subunit AcrA (membrane-fusion protein)
MQTNTSTPSKRGTRASLVAAHLRRRRRRHRRRRAADPPFPGRAAQGGRRARSVPTVNLVALKDAPTAPLELPARIEAWSRAPIYARVSGYVGSWNVDIGAPVKAGQVLATIETPDLDQDLRQAQAQLAVARSDLALAESTAKRWQSLVGQNAVSKQEADEKQGDLHVEAVERGGAAGQRRARTGAEALHAPGGALRRRGHGPQYRRRRAGERRQRSAGSELFVVSDLRKLRVYVQVPQRQVAMIKPGSVASLTVPERRARNTRPPCSRCRRRSMPAPARCWCSWRSTIPAANCCRAPTPTSASTCR